VDGVILGFDDGLSEGNKDGLLSPCEFALGRVGFNNDGSKDDTIDGAKDGVKVGKDVPNAYTL